MYYITTFPILENKTFIGLISIIRDITQEEALKEEFVNKHFEYINSERNLQNQRETFVASLGHDLKNPTIAQIRGLELLLKGNFGLINNEQKDIEDNKFMSVLAYLGLFVLIPIFAAKDSDFARFHSNQGLVLLITGFIISLIYPVLTLFFYFALFLFSGRIATLFFFLSRLLYEE